jgi:glycosyltransferase involved in cell wall biosynthesis
MNIGLITYPIEKSPAGVGTYTYNLVKNILNVDSDNNYYLLHYEKNPDPIYSENEILYKYYSLLPVMFSDSWYLFKNPAKFDIVHRFAPGGFLSRLKSKRVITVYDLFMYKAYRFNTNAKVFLARYFNRMSIKKADAVITISEFSKREIVDTFKIRADKVHVLYCGPGHMEPGLPAGKDLLRKKYDLVNDYILFVSTIEPRKNLLSLVKAFEILKDRYSIGEDLVIVGKKGWDYKPTLKYIESSSCRSSIHLMGFVPDSDLGCFYRNASLFVYPSFMEGFGIPPLEAMGCGCPTLASNTTSLPEVLRYPEMMFDPQDVDQISERCIQILRDPVRREENIKKGFQNAQRFSWRKSARQMISIYNSLTGN